MRIILFIIICFVTGFNAQSQIGEPYRISKVVLKSGDTLNGLGIYKKKGYKFKRTDTDKPYFIAYDAIDYVEKTAKDATVKTYKYQIFGSSKRYSELERTVSGSQVSLYTTVGFSGGYNGGVSTTYTIYYVQRPTESTIIEMGSFNALSSSLKDKVINYFADCPALLEKVANKDFRMRDGLEQIARFYNESCD